MVRRLIPEDKLTEKQRRQREYRTSNPERHELKKKEMREYYKKNKLRHKIVKKKNEMQQLNDDIKLLGGKCVGCGEPFNPNLPRSNLQFDHTFYIKSKGISSHTHIQIQDLVNQGIDPKEQFMLLCIECHRIITAVRRNPVKAKSMLELMTKLKIL
ncbi:hypothetical protein HY212_04175 [Candidatus Pacearchaeota archaeon]|nr:hypothetical protein [Candidatus Pacearchaeota archaeon]